MLSFIPPIHFSEGMTYHVCLLPKRKIQKFPFLYCLSFVSVPYMCPHLGYSNISSFILICFFSAHLYHPWAGFLAKLCNTSSLTSRIKRKDVLDEAKQESRWKKKEEKSYALLVIMYVILRIEKTNRLS